MSKERNDESVLNSLDAPGLEQEFTATPRATEGQVGFLRDLLVQGDRAFLDEMDVMGWVRDWFGTHRDGDEGLAGLSREEASWAIDRLKEELRG